MWIIASPSISLPVHYPVVFLPILCLTAALVQEYLTHLVPYVDKNLSIGTNMKLFSFRQGSSTYKIHMRVYSKIEMTI